jgi:hypothetical protein
LIRLWDYLLRSHYHLYILADELRKVSQKFFSLITMKRMLIYSHCALFFLTLFYSCCDCPPPKLIPVNQATVNLPATNDEMLRYVEITVNHENEIRFNDTVYSDLEILEQKMGENFDPVTDRFRLSCDRNAKAYSIFDLMEICSENEWKIILAMDSVIISG